MEKKTVCIQLLDGDHVVDTNKYSQENIIIGSGPAAHLRMEDSQVSRIHAMLKVNEHGEILLSDLGWSSEGTLHNGQKIDGEVHLEDGDLVQIGGSFIRVFGNPPDEVAEFGVQKAAVLPQSQQLRGEQTFMPSNTGDSAVIQVHGADVFATGFVGIHQAHGADAFATGFVGRHQAHGADAFSTGFVGNEGQTRLTVGRVVGERYRLLRMLGRGGMGEVWLAEDTRLGRAFALKFLAAELVGSAEALSRMHREYEVLEKLSHPNIVRVFDLDQDKESGRWYLRMEYVAGEDMGEKIDVAAQQAHRPLFGMDTMMGWLEQLVNALDYAHQQGILHRDIKPANLMLTTEPQRLKVMDFGIARVVSGTHTTQHTAMMGSIYYAAPELLRGQAATPAVDIYSFGVLVYEMLTGKLPVGRFALPSAVVQGVSKGVDDALERMFQANPKQRGESLREAWLPLRDALLGKEATVVVPSKPAPAWPKIEVIAPPPPQAKSAEPSAGERRVFRLGGVDFAMRWIPAGRFWMGAGANDKKASDDEKPQHEATLTRGFWMGETLVTQRLYQTITGKNPSGFTQAGLDAPVEQVSWHDAAAFAKTNSLRCVGGGSACFGEEWSGDEGEGIRQAITRDVKVGDYRRKRSGNTLVGRVRRHHATGSWARLRGITRTAAVQRILWGRSKRMLGGCTIHWGMSGRWCYDRYGGYSSQALTRSDRKQLIGTGRVCRGGSWNNLANSVCAARRSSSTPSLRNYLLGFRVVRSGL